MECGSLIGLDGQPLKSAQLELRIVRATHADVKLRDLVARDLARVCDGSLDLVQNLLIVSLSASVVSRADLKHISGVCSGLDAEISAKGHNNTP